MRLETARRPAPASRRRRTLGAALALALGGAVVLVAPVGAPSARAATVAQAVLLPTGRLLTPAGSSYDATRVAGERAVDLGDFPLGLALSPTGDLAVSTDNGYGTGVNTGFNSTCQGNQSKPGVACPGVASRFAADPAVHTFDEGLDVVDLASGAHSFARAVPPAYAAGFAANNDKCTGHYNCFGLGVAFSPDGRHVYAAGAGTDQVYDFTRSGAALTLSARVDIPSPARLLSRAAGDATPVIGPYSGNPSGLAVTPDGSTLVVADVFDSTVEAFDISGGRTPALLGQGLLAGGIPGPAPVTYLYGVAATNTTAYVTAEGTGTVYSVPIAPLRALGVAPLGAPTTPAQAAAALRPAVATALSVPGLDHPTGLAIAPGGGALAVTGANSDTVTVLPIIAGVASAVGARTARLELQQRAQAGSVPNAAAFSPDGGRLYVALAGDNTVAVLDPTTLAVLGQIPTGWYPTGVAVRPGDGALVTVAAKGLGSRYVAGLDGNPSPPPGASIPSASYYDAANMPGLLSVVLPPSPARLAALTRQARADEAAAGGADARPPDSPIPASPGGASPITHVVYVVRENRTFDQVFGDLALRRADVNADPRYQLLAAATPNAHAVANRFAISDAFFSDGEASVQGHWWTSSANASDYLEKSWRQYYSDRLRPYDPIGTVVNPPGCSLFQAAAAHAATHPGFTFRNYGELVGFASPDTNTGALATTTCGGGAAGTLTGSPVLDPKYPNQTSLTPDDRTRAAEFLADSGLRADGSDAGNGNTLRNFNYLILSEDHTSGLAGVHTPRSQVAQNDAALGQIISALSASRYWSSTAVVAVEDDSQDGFDHVDGHRNVLLVASPWARQRSGDGCLPGYVSHVHADQAGVLHTLELILGLPPLSAYDAGAAPLYDLFQPTSRPDRLTPGSFAPFPVAPPPPFIDETVAGLPSTPTTAAMVAASRSLDTTRLDVAEPQLEGLLWQSVRSDPLPPPLAAALHGDPETPVGPGHPLTVAAATTPTLSTLTGRPVAGVLGAAACGQPVVLTAPVKPGQTTAPGARAGAGGQALAATGASGTPVRVALGCGLLGCALLLAAGSRATTRRTSR